MASQAWETNSRSKASSPMVTFMGGLRLLKFMGLPLECKNEQATEFGDKGRFWKCMLPVGEKYFLIRVFRNLWRH